MRYGSKVQQNYLVSALRNTILHSFMILDGLMMTMIG
jgi:hypothetical protein